VLVQGDTTSALAGALAANASGIPLVHLEAGLRSFDRAMPEEHNRVLIDHLADLCSAPTPLARDNLLAERITPDRIELTGNTIVEAVATALPNDHQQAQVLRELGLRRHGYVLATIHRPVRRSNERPEVEQTFGHRALPGQEINQIVTAWLTDTTAINARLADIPTPFGDGTASGRLVHAMRSRYSRAGGAERRSIAHVGTPAVI
jgi:UDP-N-acetylglucosamine 2-epimerase